MGKPIMNTFDKLHIPMSERVGQFIGGLISYIFRNKGSRDAFVNGVRVGINHSSLGVYNTPILLNEGLLDAWKSQMSNRSIAEIASLPAINRNAWVAKKAMDIPLGANVLDAGAGECQYRKLFTHTNYKSQDFAQYPGMSTGPQKEQWNYGNIDYVSDITNIPVASESFDVVLCTEVLEHVPDAIATIRELARILKLGGTLLLSAPLGAGLHQEPFHFYGGFTPHFYNKYLVELGFEIEEITPLGGLFQHVAQECHRVGQVLNAKAKSDALERGLIEGFTNWIPHVLSDMDERYFVGEFTTGYVVSAIKRK
jgi:SAM-dependent methyltransferase